MNIPLFKAPQPTREPRRSRWIPSCWTSFDTRLSLCPACRGGTPWSLAGWFTLWLFNIAMENDPFIEDFPINTSIYSGFSMAMLNNQMVFHGKFHQEMEYFLGGSPMTKRKPPCFEWRWTQTLCFSSFFSRCIQYVPSGVCIPVDRSTISNG